MSVQNVLRKVFTPIINRQYRVRHFCSSLTTGTLSTGKDLKQVSTVDILMSKFKHATSTKEVLNTVYQHEKVMNAKHIMQALRSLFVLQKEGRSELSTKEIITNKDFSKLCGRLKYLAGVIDTNETIEALKIITYVGVPKDSTIVQVLLQLIRHSINDLSLSNIMFLEFLLGQYSNVPLAEALKIAIPIVFEIQLPVKMDRDSISSLREYLFFASRNNLSNKSVDLILSKMLKCEETADAKIAKSIVWSLTDLSSSPIAEPLLKKNMETLVVHMDDLSYDDMDTTLSKLSSAYNRDCPYFRNKIFCDAVVGHIIDKDLGYKSAIYTMRKLDRLDVINKYLIDYTSQKIQEESVIQGENSLFNYHILLKYLSKTDHRPPNWEFIDDLIENMKIPKVKQTNWLKLGAAQCCLEIFNENLLTKCLSEDLQNKFGRRRGNIYLFLAIYHSIKLHKPQLLKLIPRDLRPKDLIQYLLVPEDFPLESALYNAFGGENYVKSGIYSKEGIFIDHAIVFRKGGYPVATNVKSTFIEDFDVSTENQVILIMGMPPQLYNEANRLKASVVLSLKVLEDLGYAPIPICIQNWELLPDYEKIPYLVRSVKEKLGQDMMLANEII